ncbi:MAG: TRAM domain-containing protein, partial [Acidimicrobiia bacterium]
GVISERFGRLVEIQNASSLRRNQEMVGRTYEVLTEGPSRKDPHVATTRTRGGKLVHVEGQFPAGEFFDTEIVTAAPHHLFGR